MTILAVNHVTTYAYSKPVGLGDHRMMLRPREGYDLRLLRSTLDIDPAPQRLRWVHDVFDNCVALASFVGATQRLRVESYLTLDHTPLGGPDVPLEDHARFYPFSCDADEMPDIARAVERSHPGTSGELDRWASRFVHQGRPTETGALCLGLPLCPRPRYRRAPARRRLHARLASDLPARRAMGRIRSDQRYCRQSRPHPGGGGSPRPPGGSVVGDVLRQRRRP